ncbi:MAG: hypothetical protein AAGA81_04570 [Acidobacteriota bacterium]
MPCNEPYVLGVSTDEQCYALDVNERFFAVLTAASGSRAGTAQEVADWVRSLDSSFEPFVTTANASSPPTLRPYQVLREPLFSVRGSGLYDFLHLFFRPNPSASIESVLDSLVAQRTKDWFLSPVFKTTRRTRDPFDDGSSFPHEYFRPHANVYDFPNGSSLDEIRSLDGSVTRIEDARGIALSVRLEGPNGFELLEVSQRLNPTGVDWFSIISTDYLYLPGDPPPSGGPSGGPPGGAATAVPISDRASLLLAAALGLSAVLWLRQR